MNLQFDSIADLEEFLDFIGRVAHRAADGARASAPASPPTDPLPTIDLSAGGVAFDTPPNGAGDQEGTNAAAGEPSAEKVTRKRRTKAEIAADAERIARDAAAAVVADANREEHGAEAAAAYAQGAETPAGANPFAVAPGDAAQAPTQTDAERMKSRALELAGGAADAATSTSEGEPEPAAGGGEVSVIEHLNIARGFIATHGMPKYNESFTLCGLDPNVMAYTAEQRKAHADALAKLGATA